MSVFYDEYCHYQLIKSISFVCIRARGHIFECHKVAPRRFLLDLFDFQC